MKKYMCVCADQANPCPKPQTPNPKPQTPNPAENDKAKKEATATAEQCDTLVWFLDQKQKQQAAMSIGRDQDEEFHTPKLEIGDRTSIFVAILEMENALETITHNLLQCESQRASNQSQPPNQILRYLCLL